MHIRRLELQGFKSFVSRTRLEFHDGVTAVVGPNGCGKSNIVDAIRWVLGEQSPSHLRGKSMEDVIFNGNERTGPHGMAEVSLVMERGDSGPLWDPDPEGEGVEQETDLQRQLASVSEITVTRKYFRSGESEYLINRVPCRLRDITELFLGSGVGTKAYSIIEQGRVDQLVNAKPEALRLFIEEAAGTTRYRSRRVVAERKLERTRDNLARLSDVVREIERQINTLTRQAKRAEEYRRYRGELRTLELRVARRRHATLVRQVEESASRLAPLADKEARLVSELHTAEQAASDAHVAVRRADEQQREAQVKIVQLRLEGQGSGQRIGFIDETLRDLERRRQETDEERARLRAEIDRISADGSTAAQTLEQLQAEARDGSARRESLETELRELTASAAEAESAVERIKADAVEVLASQLRLQSQLGAQMQQMDQLAERSRRTADTCARLAGAVDERRAELDRVRAQITALQAEASELEATRHAQLNAVDQARAAEASAARAAENARERVAGLGSRLRSLEELAARWDGCVRGVRHVVENTPDRVLGVVADVLHVPKSHEAAVAAAVGPRLQSLIVRDHSDSIRALDGLAGDRGGRASFIPVSPRGPVPVEPSGSLLQVVSTAPEYRDLARSLLGNVRLVDSVADAVALWRQNGTPVTAVTTNGELIDSLGVLTGGSDRPVEETLLARNREIRELRGAIAIASAAADDAAERHRIAADRVAELRRAYEDIADRLQNIQIDHARAAKDDERLVQDHERLTLEHEAAVGDGHGLADDLRTVESALSAIQRALEEATQRRARKEGELATSQQHVSNKRAATDTVRRSLDDLRAVDAQRRESIGRVEEVRRQGAARLQQLGGQLAALDGRTAQLDGEGDRLRRDRVDVEEQRTTLAEQQAHAEAEAMATVDRATAAAEDATRSESTVRERRDALEECRESERALELSLAELRANVEHLLETVQDKYGEDFTVPATDSAVGTPDDNDDGIEQRIQDIRARLERIGDVHVGAIEELEELRTRHEYLTRQSADLERSVDDLRRTIAKLNRLSRSRFRETFEQANVKLGQVFPRLFPGGRAHLLLIEPEDGGEAGVEIIVQPVGKKLGSLTLLSGGEKAMTAVALILSLFMIRPTPFCILDEVDAPLDDANVGRFDHLVREISQTSQFVLITHNKRTMEAADTLYGITMQEAGVSKVVSVRLEQAA
jgi:chromosome segregation protein